MSQVQQTSLEAYYSDVLPSLSQRQKLILGVLLQGGDWTNTEISSYLGIPINTVTPRVNELVHPKDPKEKPLIEEVGKRKCKITGRTAIAWRVVKKEPANPTENRIVT